MKLANKVVMIMTVAGCLISSLSYPEEKAGRRKQEAVKSAVSTEDDIAYFHFV